MKIQLLTLICAAFGLSLPEIPNLPDLVGIVDNAVHGNFTAQTVEEPQEFLPTIVEIRAMTDQEKTDRFHWFLCVFLLVFVCVVISGTVIMMVGAELKALGSYQALGETTPLSQGAQLRLVMLSFGSTVLLSFAATLWSLENGRLSKLLGLDWEVYLFLFCCAGASLLVQALLAVAWLNRGDRFDATAFTVASFSSMAPLLSDQWDTLKDIIFGGLCLQSQQFCFNELATSHLSVLLIAPKVQGEWSGGCWEGMILPTIYRQVTRSKRHHLLIESVPQGVMSVLFLTIEGGSFFIAALNLVVPSVQIALTCFLFKPMRAAAIPALGKRLSRAMKSGNIVAAKALWEEAEITGERQLFQLILPHLTFFLATVQSCGFMSEEMKDLEKLSDEELDTLQCIASVFAGEALCDLSDLKIGDSGAKVVAEALKSSTTRWLYLGNNDIGDEGAEALADSLKSNSSLVELYLPSNNIGDRGAEALAESLQINGSLGQLDLQNNNIGDPGTEVLAAGLMQNRSLRRLSLSKFGSSRELWRAPGLQALEEAEKIKREWGDDCEICWY